MHSPSVLMSTIGRKIMSVFNYFFLSVGCFGISEHFFPLQHCT